MFMAIESVRREDMPVIEIDLFDRPNEVKRSLHASACELILSPIDFRA